MPFTARYQGRCFICGGRIEPGDSATFTDDDELAHPDCEDVGEPPPKPPCPRCWMVHAGECL
jgi:hypothetical protein